MVARAKQKPVDGLEKGDEVYAKHPKHGAVKVRVLAVGKDGYTAEDEQGERHKLHHDTYLGHKTRQLHTYHVVDQGADGVLAERQDGQRRFLRGELPKEPEASQDSNPGAGTGQEQDPLIAGLDDIMAKALRPLAPRPVVVDLFMKAAGSIANRPGLALRDTTDRSGKHTKRWVRTMKDEPHPREKKAEEAPKPKMEAATHKHGDTVSFKHGDVEGHGKIVASGKDGVTVQTEDGREHQVRHDALDKPPAYPEREEGQDDKAYLKKHGDSLPSPKHVPEEHERFFNMEGATSIPISDLVSTKSDADNEKGGKNAPKFMMAAYHGKVAKRDPITVRKREDGKYEVVDGNGTFTGAKAAGWKSLPVKIEGQEQGAGADAGGVGFDQADMALPKSASQPANTAEAIAALTTEGQQQLGDWLDKGKGAAIQAGFVHQEGGPEGEVLDKPGKLLFIAPPKSIKRATEKVESDYGGDWSQLLDPVRCSLAVDDFSELREALLMLKASGMKLARAPKDRFAKPTPVGYRDCLLNVTLPNGLIGEIQLHTKAMLKAKADGHKWYEIERTLSAKEEKGTLSAEEKQKLLASREAQSQIYGEAWTASTSGKNPASDMKKALDMSASPYTYFELDNAKFRRLEKPGRVSRSIDDVLHGSTWVPYKGDRLAPATFGDEIDDPLGSGEGGDPAKGDGSPGEGGSEEPPEPPAPMAKAMPLLILKAQITGGAAADLFPTTVHVKGSTRGGRFVLPYTAVRHKTVEPHEMHKPRTPPETSQPVALLPAGPVTPAEPASTAAAINGPGTNMIEITSKREGTPTRVRAVCGDEATAARVKAAFEKHARLVKVDGPEVSALCNKREASSIMEDVEKLKRTTSALPASGPAVKRMVQASASAPNEITVAGVRHVLTGYGKNVRISEDDPAVWGSHLLGHEGSFGKIAYYRPA